MWDKAAKDEQGLASFFKKNKKKYAWEEPRFKGMVFHVKQAEDVQAVKARADREMYRYKQERKRTAAHGQ